MDTLNFRQRMARLRRPVTTGTAAFLGMAVLGGAIFYTVGGPDDGISPVAGTGLETPARVVGPSEAAQMICSLETRSSVAAALALPEPPMPRDEWKDQTYVCTYDLEGGQLVLAVNELADAAGASRAFADRMSMLGEGASIEGLAGLGLPGFQASAGIVLFAKDNMTLEVDASGMPVESGPEGLSRSDLAYQLASNVLACWRAHH